MNLNLVMKILLLLAFGLSISVQAEDVPEDKRKNVEVIMGIDKIQKLDFVPDARIQIGNEAVLNYTLIPSKKEIVFKGVKAGKTSIDIRNSTGDIKARYLVNISTNDKAKVVSELRELIGEVEGIEIGIKGGSVYVGGKIVVPRDIGKVNVVLSKYQDVLKFVELSEQTLLVVSKKIQDEVHRNGYKNVTVKVINGMIWLEGVVTSDNIKNAIIPQIVDAYMPDKLSNLADGGDGFQGKDRNKFYNFISVQTKPEPQPQSKQVKITAQFVEIAKDYSKVFGLQWTPFLSGDGGSVSINRTSDGGLSTNSNGVFSGVISNLFPKLNSAKEAGYARVVQSGVILTKDNVEGTIDKKQDFPFTQGGTENAQGKVASTGFNLGVKPTVGEEEKINLSLRLGVSVLTGLKDDGTPLTSSNNVSTELVVVNKESAVVGGVVQSTTKTDYDKYRPGGTPSSENGSPLFNLLRSKQYISSKSQYVVFVTPEIVESASAGTEAVRRKFKRRSR